MPAVEMDAVRQLTKYLDMAKKGELQSFVIAGILCNGEVQVGCCKTNMVDLALLSGSVQDYVISKIK